VAISSNRSNCEMANVLGAPAARHRNGDYTTALHGTLDMRR